MSASDPTINFFVFQHYLMEILRHIEQMKELYTFLNNVKPGIASISSKEVDLREVN